MSDAQARSPAREWARRQALGELTALEWVNTDAAFALASDPRAQSPGFAAPSLGRELPDAMVQAARAVAQTGGATMLEATALLLSRPHWFAANRDALWSAFGPTPSVLASLLAGFGIGPELHRDDPACLARLTARLTVWSRRRGELGPTLDLAREALEIDLGGVLRRAGPESDAPALLRDEVLAARADGWWAARADQQHPPKLRIVDGLVRFQSDGTSASLLREDVLLLARRVPKGTAEVIRLLPANTCLRVVAPIRESR